MLRDLGLLTSSPIERCHANEFLKNTGKGAKLPCPLMPTASGDAIDGVRVLNCTVRITLHSTDLVEVFSFNDEASRFDKQLVQEKPHNCKLKVQLGARDMKSFVIKGWRTAQLSER